MSGFDALGVIGDEENQDEMVAAFGEMAIDVVQDTQNQDDQKQDALDNSSSSWSQIAGKKKDEKVKDERREDRKGSGGGGGGGHRQVTGTPVTFDKLHLVVVAGVPGSGKSTVTKPLATQLGWGRVNQDEMKNRRSCEHWTKNYLKKSIPVVVDRCNFDRKQRSHWVKIAKKFDVAKIDAIVLNTPVAECIRRTTQRSDHETITGGAFSKGPDICLGMANRFRNPLQEEGFDRVFVFDFHGYNTSVKKVLEAIAEWQAEEKNKKEEEEGDEQKEEQQPDGEKKEEQKKEEEEEEVDLMDKWSKLIDRVDGEQGEALPKKIKVPSDHVEVCGEYDIQELVTMDTDGRIHIHFDTKSDSYSREHVFDVSKIVLGLSEDDDGTNSTSASGEQQSVEIEQ